MSTDDHPPPLTPYFKAGLIHLGFFSLILCLRAGEKVTVTPSSKELLFYPPEVEATITGGMVSPDPHPLVPPCLHQRDVTPWCLFARGLPGPAGGHDGKGRPLPGGPTLSRAGGRGDIHQRERRPHSANHRPH